MTLFESMVAGNFHVLADVVGLAEKDVAPVLPLRFFYHQDLSQDPAGDPLVLDFDRIKKNAAQLEDGRIVIVDLEATKIALGDAALPVLHTPWDITPAKLKNTRDVLGMIVQAIKQENGSLKVGWFCGLPARHLNGFHAGRGTYRWTDYLEIDKFLNAFFSDAMLEKTGLDLLTPAFYVGYHHWVDSLHRPEHEWLWRDSPLWRYQDTPLAVWKSLTLHGLELIRGIYRTGVVLPLFSLQWWSDLTQYDCPARGDWLFPSWIKAMLDAGRAFHLLGFCNSIGLWTQPSQAGMSPEEFLASPYWQAITAYLDQ